MSTAFVLISCEIGTEKQVIDEIKSLDHVIQVTGVMGSYDIIVKLEAFPDELRNIISSKIRQMKNLRTALTLTVVESQE